MRSRLYPSAGDIGSGGGDPERGQTAASASIPDFPACGPIRGFPATNLCVGSDLAEEQVATRRRREQSAPACRRLHQSDSKPETAATVKKFGEMSISHFGFHNPRNQCWPNGIPFVLSSNGLEIFQKPDKVTMIYQVDHQIRHMRMNATHPENVTPTYYGDSVGHYEGDTLVIDTVGIKPGPFAMIDWFGTPQTPALHVVERYRLLDYEAAKDGLNRASKENALPQPPAVDLDYRGKHLQLTFTVEDPNVFTMPWSATVTYGRPAVDWLENVCAENPNKYGTEEDVQLPTAKRPDFCESVGYEIRKRRRSGHRAARADGWRICFPAHPRSPPRS